MGEGLGRTSKFHSFADIVPADGAKIAGLARLANLEGNLVSHDQIRDVRSNSRNDTA